MIRRPGTNGKPPVTSPALRQKQKSGRGAAVRKLIAFLKDWRNQLVFMKWLGRHIRPYLPQIVLLTVLNSLASISAIGLAYFTKEILDNATASQPVMGNVLWYVAITVISLGIRLYTSIATSLINERFAFGIRAQIYKSVLNSCYQDVSQYHSGDILTRLTSDADAVAGGVSEVIPTIISLVVSFVSAFIYLAYVDFSFSLFVLILGPITAVVSFFAGRMSKRVQVKVQESESAYRAELQESLENVLVVKAFEGQDEASQRLLTLRNQRLYWIRRRQIINSTANMLLQLVFQGTYVAVLAYASLQLSVGAITMGTLLLFQSLVGQVQAPFAGLSQLVPRLVSILASSGRIRELEALPPEDMCVPAMAPGPLALQMENVLFGYRDELIFTGASLTIEPGQFVALTGHSGIGKTTLVRLILSYYQPQSGVITLSSGDTAGVPVNAGARHYISYVPQGNTLISGTIAYNLRTGQQDATEEKMWEVLRVVAAEDFVRSTENGLDTYIGERGQGLSEGQAQRIAIARALIKEAPLLILDEATSALDEATETAVLQHLRKNQPRPTCIIITHRHSVLQYCDRCLIIRDHQVEEARKGEAPWLGESLQ